MVLGVVLVLVLVRVLLMVVRSVTTKPSRVLQLRRQDLLQLLLHLVQFYLQHTGILEQIRSVDGFFHQNLLILQFSIQLEHLVLQRLQLRSR